jgi:hypothetical protein
VVGLTAGTCVAAKLHLVPIALVLAGCWVLVQRGVRPALRALAGAAAGGTAVSVPGPLLLFAQTGNPVFPQLNHVFRSEHYPPVNEQYNFPYFKDGSLGALLRLPVEAIRQPSLYVEAVPTAAFGVLPLLLVAAIVMGWRLGRAWLPVWVAVTIAMAYWWLSFRYLRYALPPMVVAVAMLSHLRLPAWALLRPGPRSRAVLPAAGVFGVALMALIAAPPTLASFWNIPERFPIRAAFGEISDADYENRSLAEARALRRFNGLASPGDVLVGPTGVHTRTLLEPDLDLTPTWELTTVLSLAGPPPADDQSLRDRAHRWGVDWALVDSGGDLSRGDPLVARLVQRFGVLEHAVDNLVLYRLSMKPATAPAPTPVSLCDPTFSPGSSCWGAPLDATRGLSSTEAPGGVFASVPVCPGTTYRAAAPAVGSGTARVVLTAGPEPVSSVGESTPGTSATAALTVPPGVRTLSLQVVAFGAVTIPDVRLDAISARATC